MCAYQHEQRIPFQYLTPYALPFTFGPSKSSLTRLTSQRQLESSLLMREPAGVGSPLACQRVWYTLAPTPSFGSKDSRRGSRTGSPAIVLCEVEKAQEIRRCPLVIRLSRHYAPSSEVKDSNPLCSEQLHHPSVHLDHPRARLRRQPVIRVALRRESHKV